MEFYQWLNEAVGDFDVFAVLNEEEAKRISGIFGPGAETASRSGIWYYFLNTENKTVTPMPFLALAFGGQYNGWSPVGTQLSMSEPDWAAYRLESSKWAKKDRADEGGKRGTPVLKLFDLSASKEITRIGSYIPVGRSSDSGIPVLCPQVSRKHAAFVFEKDGWVLKDLNSKNGSCVNGEPLEPFKPRVLRPGDTIKLADLPCFQFRGGEGREEAGKTGVVTEGPLLQQALNKTYPGLAMLVRDADLPAALAEKYRPDLIIREKAFTDASCRIGGMVTTHRYVILSSHMANFAPFEHGTNWGLFVAQSGSRFKVMKILRYRDKTAIVLLHLPDDESWRVLADVSADLDEQLLKKVEERFRVAVDSPPIPELSGRGWLDRCAFPLGMSAAGELWPLDDKPAVSRGEEPEPPTDEPVSLWFESIQAVGKNGERLHFGQSAKLLPDKGVAVIQKWGPDFSEEKEIPVPDIRDKNEAILYLHEHGAYVPFEDLKRAREKAAGKAGTPKGVCPNCGTPTVPGTRFCSACGTRLDI